MAVRGLWFDSWYKLKNLRKVAREKGTDFKLWKVSWPGAGSAYYVGCRIPKSYLKAIDKGRLVFKELKV